MTALCPIRRALISVSDKSGLLELAQALHESHVEIISTGGTAAFLREKKIPVRMVADVTGFPEIMEGRVKTLHPKIHGGLLARRDKADHREALERHDIPAIDLAIVNLYPFQATIDRKAGFEEAIENIDIGGPAMIRAAAKNHDFLAIVTDPLDYPAILTAIAEKGGTDLSLRRHLAKKAFAHTAAYDSTIAAWLCREEGEKFPASFLLSGKRKQILRYGENPHQQAALYENGKEQGLPQARFLQGKELSYNNLADGDAALSLLSEFSEPCAIIVKHGNPCGAALAPTIGAAYEKALAADPVSAFGGIVALNRPVDAALGMELAKLFLEVILAPSFEEEALSHLKAKKNLRLLALPIPDPAARLNLKTITGGFLLQDRDVTPLKEWKDVTEKKSSDAQRYDCAFAERVVKHVGSNAIVLAREGQTIGIGAGQMSRIDAVKIALAKAGAKAKGAILASDAFFPFADSIAAAQEAGIACIIQPGGAQRDQEVITACDQGNIAMIFTGYRHFKH